MIEAFNFTWLAGVGGSVFSVPVSMSGTGIKLLFTNLCFYDLWF